MNHPKLVLPFLILTFANLGFGMSSRQHISNSIDKIDKLSRILHTNLDSIFTKEYIEAFGTSDTSNLLNRVTINFKNVNYRTKHDYFIQVDDLNKSRVVYLGFIYFPPKYTFYYRCCYEGRNATINSISRMLKLDFKELLTQEYRGNYDPLEGALCTIKPINFSHKNGEEADYLIYIDYFGYDVSLAFGFVFEKGKYYARFKYYGAGKSAACPKPVDIDSDGKMELLMEIDEAGNQSTKSSVTIWRYQKNNFQRIFSEGLVECYMYCPYSYHNTYEFIKNSVDTSILDISFHVKTETEFMDSTEASSFYKRYGSILPVKDSAIYIFNGIKYNSKKKLYDYRRFLQRWCKENNY